MEDDGTFDFLNMPNNMAYMPQQQPEQIQQQVPTSQFVLHQPLSQQPHQPQQQVQHGGLLTAHSVPVAAPPQRPNVNVSAIAPANLPVLLQQGVVTQADNGSLGFCPSQVLQPQQSSNGRQQLPIQLQAQLNKSQQISVQPQQQQMKKQISPKPAQLKKQPAIQQKPVAPATSQPGQIVLQSVGQLPNGDKVPQVNNKFKYNFKISFFYNYFCFKIKISLLLKLYSYLVLSCVSLGCCSALEN